MAEALNLTAPAQKSRYRGKAREPRAKLIQSLRPASELKRSPTKAEPAQSPQDRWRSVFSDAQNRLIVRGLRSLADTLAADTQHDLAALIRIEEAQDQISAIQKERLDLLLEAIDLEECDASASSIKTLRSKAATKAQDIKDIERNAAAARIDRYALLGRCPPGWRLLDNLDRTLADWSKKVDPWPEIAALVSKAARAHETVLGIIADQAVAWSWRGDVPKQWLSYAGYTPALDPVDIRSKDDEAQVVRTIQHVHLIPPIPADIVFTTLTPDSMSPVERKAVSTTRKNRRKTNDQLTQQWLDTMRDSLSPEDLAAYEKRARVWADTGWAGRQAAGKWLNNLFDGTGLEPPKLQPQFVSVRWPIPEKGTTPAEGTLRYLDIGRDAVVLADEEILTADIEAGDIPKPAPLPPIFPEYFGFVDTETTGMLGDKLAEVIEIGAVILDRRGNEVDRFSELAKPWNNPNRPDARAALNVSGIKISELRRAHPIAEVAARFQKWLASWRHPVLTAYNVGFDKAMLKRHGIKANWGRCAMHLAKRVRDGSSKLEDISGDWGLRTEAQEHRALSDVRISVAVLLETVRRLEVAAQTDKKDAAALKKFLAALVRPAAPPTGSST